MSNTRTVPPKAESRAFDHVYDPVSTYASAADHAKLTRIANVGNYKSVPSSQYYFSELPHYPRAQLQPTTKDLLGENVFTISI